jgi:hypothetical protein
MSDLKTADGVPFCDITGDVYEPSETGVRAGHVHRMVLEGWNNPARAKITATVCLPNGCCLECQPEAWYADRALAYRKHIELVQNAANKLVAKALEAMNGGAA